MASFKPDYTYLDQFIDQALWEDVHEGDVTALATIPSDKRDRAVLKVKANGILAGVELAQLIFKKCDSSVSIKVFMHDGDAMTFGDIAFEVECGTQALLKAERLVLNTMQRMSGIATMSRTYADAVADLPVKILDTRKTTPLTRHLEKWAVKIGGCENYRYGLYDWFMIKDNHTDANGGSVAKAIQKIADYKKMHPSVSSYGVTVEVRSLEELKSTMDAGKGIVTRIMLDNFKPELMKEAVGIVNHQFEVEASGGVTLQNLREIALTGVDYISSGALTHSVISLDLSLKVVKVV
ncbi:MAG: carboxylating nicotinate-nucleotide diphosphorylase [Saprospiraceae bacterium]|nr:carboxylating nicotinate-nucleotide diphosphorylase [Saprospiraceae bacterium]